MCVWNVYALLIHQDRDNVAMAITRKDADEELDGNMSKYGKQENRPLLIVTAASTPSSPNTQRGDSDYQYSNRDVSIDIRRVRVKPPRSLSSH